MTTGLRKKTRKAATTKRYETHDNGGRPFLVEVAPAALTITRQTWNGSAWTPAAKPIKRIAYSRIWIGKGGNSITAQIGPATFLHIGRKAFTFGLEPGDAVVRVDSPIGNSDVPYPVLIGKTHSYFLTESNGVGVVANEHLNVKRDLYGQFYGLSPTVKAQRSFKRLLHAGGL